jgi:hypothetical protein
MRGNEVKRFIQSVYRFQSPTMLVPDTVILGIAAKIWVQVFTGNMEHALKLVKLKSEQINSRRAATVNDRAD